MLALGSVKAIITDSVKNGRIHFDMHGFLTNVILADLNLSGMFQHMPDARSSLDLSLTWLYCSLRPVGQIFLCPLSENCLHPTA